MTGRASGTHVTSANAEGTNEVENGIVGAILDCSSRVGKEERVAMEMAIEDVNKKQRNQRLIFRVKCSRGGPVQAAQAGKLLQILPEWFCFLPKLCYIYL